MATQLSNLQQRGGQIDRPQKNIFDLLDDPRVKQGIAAVATKFMTPERFLRLAINAVRKTPRLGECDPTTVLGCFMTAASLGLEPNTVLQQAFLVPYKKRANRGGKWVDVYECQFQIGYRGFVTLAGRSEDIIHIEAEAIREGDLFDNLQGSESFLKYRKALKGRGELLGAYCYTRHTGGDEKATVLPLDELLKIRSKSETYNSLVRGIETAENAAERAKAEKKLAETPWVMWEDDMAAKSALKKHAKQLDFSEGDRMRAAAEIDSKAEGMTIDMGALGREAIEGKVEQAMAMAEEGYIPELTHEPGEKLEMPANFQQPQEQVQQEQAPQRRHQRQAPIPGDGFGDME